MLESLSSWEIYISLFLQKLFEGTFFQQLVYIISYLCTLLGESYVAVVIICFIYWSVDKQIGKKLGFTVVSISVLTGEVKNFFKRERPYQFNSEVKLLKDVDGYSFFSGHSSNSAALFNSLRMLFKGKTLKVLAIVLPILVGISRIYLGAHFFSDVVVGLLFGYIFSYLLIKLQENSKHFYIYLLLIGFIGMFYCDSTDFYSTYGILIGLTLGNLFEEKYVNFKKAESLKEKLLRLVLGILLFLALSFTLKSVFNLFNFNQYILIVLRYGINVFICVGIYPMCFKYLKK